MTSKWIKLTRTDDEPVWFSVDQIVLIEPALDEGSPDARTAIYATNSVRRYVKETVDTVEKML